MTDYAFGKNLRKLCKERNHGKILKRVLTLPGRRLY